MSPDNLQAVDGSIPLMRCGVGRGRRAAFHAARLVLCSIRPVFWARVRRRSRTDKTAAVITDASSGDGSGVISSDTAKLVAAGFLVTPATTTGVSSADISSAVGSAEDSDRALKVACSRACGAGATPFL
jgi:hypothetical protein